MSNPSGTTAHVLQTRAPEDGKPQWALTPVTLPAIQDDELLVKIVASGICHTDLIFATRPGGDEMYPRVLGHEGAGYVEQVGSKVTVASVGDPVLLSFASCQSCPSCKNQHPAYCTDFNALNYGPSFFGQSSFASMSVVKQSSVTNVAGLVKDTEELKMFAPMGCGFQTGAGAITNIASAGPHDKVVVIGLGGVGLAAVMAAKIKGCGTIIGVDRVADRLGLAKDLGATHTINTSDSTLDVVTAVRDATEGQGSTITIDTTGNMQVIRSGVEFTAFRGQMIFIGVPPPDAELNVQLIPLIQSGKQLRGCIEGDAFPAKNIQYIPQMISWFREGKFELDRIVKFYPAEEYEQALTDMKRGHTIKPVLVW